MKESLEILLAGVVDYAGLFPPAALGMAAAVESYGQYLRDPDRRMLGRFVVPVVRLREFDEAAASSLPRGEGSEPWRLSALPGPDIAADIDLALKFNCRHWSGSEIGHAVIDAFEVKVSTAAEIAAAAAVMPAQIAPFFEIPIRSDPTELVAAIKRSGASAKMRTGGVTPDAFPDVGDVVRFMMACGASRLPFKLTAGLHHPIRAEYRLTYADDPPRGVMFGYLNMFVAATMTWTGADEATVRSALLATNAEDFQFTDDSIGFRGRIVAADVIRDARENFVISFGSCSFREPVDDLHALSIS
ncbi:MAG: hypothetical protein ABI035_00595 [Gemmatimonadaceae bacterium]